MRLHLLTDVYGTFEQMEALVAIQSQLYSWGSELNCQILVCISTNPSHK